MIAFYLPGGAPVYVFSLLVSLGAAAGLFWLVERTVVEAPVQASWQTIKRRGLRQLNAGLAVLLGALLGGRLAFAAVNWAYFCTHPLEILQVFQGGLSGMGALCGAIFALTIFARIVREPLPRLADSILPLAATLTISVWVGCWLEGCAYGAQIDWGIPSLDEWGQISPRLPVQLIGAALTVLLAWWLDRSRTSTSDGGVKDARPEGWSAALGLMGLSLIVLIVSFLRADPGPTWNGLRLEAWAALGWMAWTGVWMSIQLKKIGRTLRTTAK